MLRLLEYLLMLAVGAFCAGFVFFIQQVPTTSPDNSAPPTEAVVVLTGGANRIESGTKLLQAGNSQYLYISGVHPAVHKEKLLGKSGLSAEKIACCVFTDAEAVDTSSNASVTAAWLHQKQIKSIRLVTANYHLPRSLLEFSHHAPDVTVIPYAVIPKDIDVTQWWQDWPTLRFIAWEYIKYLAVLTQNITGALWKKATQKQQ